MATNPFSTGLGKLDSVTNTVTAAALKLSSIPSADTSDLWPVQNWGAPDRQVIAGIPNLEPYYHQAFEQGRMLDVSLGDAVSSLAQKKLDLEEKILQYLHLNRLANTTKLTDIPRAISAAADSVIFLDQVQAFIADIQNLMAAVQADIVMLQSMETRMLDMIQANVNALEVLLAEICNWDLPSLPSIPMLLDMFHWNGFHFTYGFNFRNALASNFALPSFQFSNCSVVIPNLAGLFVAAPNTITVDGMSVTTSATTIPSDASLGSTESSTDATYVTEMQNTISAVFTPGVPASLPGSSLPNPVAIQSNYSLPATTYANNLPAVVSGLSPVIIQPGDADFGSAPSSSRISLFRALLNEFVTLSAVVDSGYDANTLAAWLYYVDLNHAGRGGTWLTGLEAVYTKLITPSITYLKDTPVPWNTVLGGSGTASAPSAIPLQALLKADTTGKLLWQLSYIEAAMLGFQRNPTWDGAADVSLTAPDTGTDLDYVAATISTTDATQILGMGTATYPVSITYPQSIANALDQAITKASAAIFLATSFQSSRPQFRYTYDQFSQAHLVDRFSQFWREYAANLTGLLAQDPYLVAFVVEYPVILDAVLNPLANSPYYTALSTDVASRNRNWTPGSILPAIPTALLASSSSGSSSVAIATSGWNGGTFDAATYLARPDIQALPIPTQVAMLRTNQSIATLQNVKRNLSGAVAASISAAQSAIAAGGLASWQVEIGENIPVPPAGLAILFDTTDFDSSHYVQADRSILIQTAGYYAIAVTLNWDPTGASGQRTTAILQNGVSVATGNSDPAGVIPFTSQVTAILTCAVGDVISVEASHVLGTPQSILAGSTFLGIPDQGGPFVSG